MLKLESRLFINLIQYIISFPIPNHDTPKNCRQIHLTNSTMQMICDSEHKTITRAIVTFISRP